MASSVKQGITLKAKNKNAKYKLTYTVAQKLNGNKKSVTQTRIYSKKITIKKSNLYYR